jgi:PadR family transcriptional regulator PadR
MKLLTLKEEIILSALMMCGGSSTGAPIRKKVIELAKKEIVYGTLYNLLEILIRKGYVTIHRSDPVPVQGVRSKIVYTITDDGKAALHETLMMHENIKRSLSDLGFEA